jgi:hypothetical protein
LRHALGELVESLELFNQRWREYLQAVNAAEVNEARAEYNRYYLLEKECALRSVRLAQIGFTQLAPLTLEELRNLLPELAVPKVVGRRVF